MGKIRVKTIGDEALEKKDQKKAQARAEAKKAREEAEVRRATEEGTDSKASTVEQKTTLKEETETHAEKPSETKKKVQKKKSSSGAVKHSKSYLAIATLVDKNKKYKLTEALSLLDKTKRTKFDETIELHINTLEKGISGNVTLPHGTGKATRVVIANAVEDSKHVEDLIKKIEAGKIDFDVLIATPDSMAKLAKVARVLGPRGLMPNPKNGTVTLKPDEIAKKFAGGQINFKTEAKFPILHLAVGKVSFGEKKLTENITSAIKAVKTKNIKDITLK
ncbi:MAG: hypothetical protein ACRD4B_05415, partial [Acidobacteriota bacterium]